MEVGSQQLKTNFKANQMLTGHENMEAYLMRFRLKQTDGMCAYGIGLKTVRGQVRHREDFRRAYDDLGIQDRSQTCARN